MVVLTSKSVCIHAWKGLVVYIPIGRFVLPPYGGQNTISYVNAKIGLYFEEPYYVYICIHIL